MLRTRYTPYILLIPSILIVFIFLILPTLMSLNFSFQDYVLSDPEGTRFVWFDNYIKIFKDSALRPSVINSVYILFFLITFSFLGSIIGALILNSIKRGRKIFLAIVILPWALPPVTNAILWRVIFSPTYGFLNGLLYKIGIIDNYIVWTNDALATVTIICIIALWKYLPLTIIIVLTAMQSIPEELYEAARIDGADSTRCFFHITFPSIRSSMAIILSISSVVALNLFDEIFVIARLRGDTRSLAMEAYFKAFQYLNFGYGSAIAYVLLSVGALASILYLKSLYRELQS